MYKNNISIENCCAISSCAIGSCATGSCATCHTQLEKWLLNYNRGYCMMCGMAAYNKSSEKFLKRKFNEKKNEWKK